MLMAAMPAAADLPQRNCVGMLHTGAAFTAYADHDAGECGKHDGWLGRQTCCGKACSEEGAGKGEMQIALARSVRVYAVQQHRDCAEHSQHRNCKANLGCAKASHPLNHGWRTENVTVVSNVEAEQKESEHPHAHMAQRMERPRCRYVRRRRPRRLWRWPFGSQSRSSLSSHGAFSGPSGRHRRNRMLSTTAGRPSIRNSHCHPARPPRPPKPRSAPASAPITTELSGREI